MSTAAHEIIAVVANAIKDYVEHDEVVAWQTDDGWTTAEGEIIEASCGRGLDASGLARSCQFFESGVVHDFGKVAVFRWVSHE